MVQAASPAGAAAAAAADELLFEFYRERDHRGWRQFIVPLSFKKVRLTSVAEVPTFAYEEESTVSVMRRVLVGIIGLVVPTLAAAAIALSRLCR